MEVIERKDVETNVHCKQESIHDDVLHFENISPLPDLKTYAAIRTQLLHFNACHQDCYEAAACHQSRTTHHPTKVKSWSQRNSAR